MIKTELYFDFRIICQEDFSEQINFYEKYRNIFEKEDSFIGILSRHEFIRRIFILYSCGIAYSRKHEYEKSISIFDIVLNEINKNKENFGIDLNKEQYYIDSLFEKGKAQYYLKMYSCAEMTFKQILDTGYANHFHSSWFTYSQNARLYNKLNDWILYFIFFLILFTNLELSLPTSISVGLGILNFILIIFYILNPSKRLSEYFTKKNIDKFNKQLENRIDSIEYFTQKINQNPNDYVALLERGIFYNLKDDYDNSLTDLNNVLKINSNNSAAFYYRAIALTKLDRHKEAIEDLSKLIKLNESDKAELYNNRGSLYLLLNNNNLALEDYCKAIELEPYYASYRFDRAYLYQENGNNTEAIADYDVVIALEPENYIAITNRGEAYYALGDKKKAFIDFKRAKDFGYLEAVENLNKFDFE